MRFVDRSTPWATCGASDITNVNPSGLSEIALTGPFGGAWGDLNRRTHEVSTSIPSLRKMRSNHCDQGL